MLNTNDFFLAGIAYELGNEKIDVPQGDQIKEILAPLGLPPVPEMLGLGSYHRMSSDQTEMTQCIKSTLVKSQLNKNQIDIVIFCGARWDGQTKKYASALISNGLSPKHMHFTTGTECTSFLNAIDISMALLSNKNLDNALVVNIDYFIGNLTESRFSSYGLFSDAVCSLIVSRSPPIKCVPYFSILASNQITDTKKICNGMEVGDFKEGEALIKNLLNALKLDQKTLTSVLSSNIYLPIKTAKEKSLGFDKKQLYLNNVSRIGHCYASDPFINLIDQLEGYETTKRESLYALYADADGQYACLIMKQN